MTTPIEITTVDGSTIDGHFAESGGMVHVTYAGHSKSTQVGGSPADSIAKMLLRELAGEVALEAARKVL